MTPNILPPDETETVEVLPWVNELLSDSVTPTKVLFRYWTQVFGEGPGGA
jgi:hypothetical protein